MEGQVHEEKWAWIISGGAGLLSSGGGLWRIRWEPVEMENIKVEHVEEMTTMMEQETTGDPTRSHESAYK